MASQALIKYQTLSIQHGSGADTFSVKRFPEPSDPGFNGLNWAHFMVHPSLGEAYGLHKLLKNYGATVTVYKYTDPRPADVKTTDRPTFVVLPFFREFNAPGTVWSRDACEAAFEVAKIVAVSIMEDQVRSPHVPLDLSSKFYYTPAQRRIDIKFPNAGDIAVYGSVGARTGIIRAIAFYIMEGKAQALGRRIKADGDDMIFAHDQTTKTLILCDDTLDVPDFKVERWYKGQEGKFTILEILTNAAMYNKKLTVVTSRYVERYLETGIWGSPTADKVNLPKSLENVSAPLVMEYPAVDANVPSTTPAATSGSAQGPINDPASGSATGPVKRGSGTFKAGKAPVKTKVPAPSASGAVKPKIPGTAAQGPEPKFPAASAPSTDYADAASATIPSPKIDGPPLVSPTETAVDDSASLVAGTASINLRADPSTDAFAPERGLDWFTGEQKNVRPVQPVPVYDVQLEFLLDEQDDLNSNVKSADFEMFAKTARVKCVVSSVSSDSDYRLALFTVCRSRLDQFFSKVFVYFRSRGLGPLSLRMQSAQVATIWSNTTIFFIDGGDFTVGDYWVRDKGPSTMPATVILTLDTQKDDPAKIVETTLVQLSPFW